jgi:quercetin dioxygenase-like cupin family protein
MLQIRSKKAGLYNNESGWSCTLSRQKKGNPARGRRQAMDRGSSREEKRVVNCQRGSGGADEQQWAAHPVFPGVRLKQLISGSDTDMRCSVHLVRIDPYCSLSEHRHEKQWELHQVLSGEGSCRLHRQEMAYLSGRMAVIPQGALHSVEAGERGLMLLASFFPATP